MLNYGRKILIIWQKDFTEEFRELNNLASTVIFALMQVFIFSFALNMAEVQQNTLYSALVWIIILFTSTLGMVRTFAREKENDALEALVLAAGERSAIFFGKFLANLTLLLVVEIVVLPVLLVFLDFRGEIDLSLFVLTVFLGSVGLSLLGTLLNSITVQIRGTQLLLPVLLFPIAIPLLIAVIECTKMAFMAGGTDYLVWTYFLVVFDLVFMIVPLLLFDYVLEA